MIAVLEGIATSANEFCCDGALARKSRIPTHILSIPGNSQPNAPDFRINNVNTYHGRLDQWSRRFNGVAIKNLNNYLGWRRTLEAIGRDVTPEALIPAAIGPGPYQQAAL